MSILRGSYPFLSPFKPRIDWRLEVSPFLRTVLTLERSLPTPFFSLPLGSVGAAELIFVEFSGVDAGNGVSRRRKSGLFRAVAVGDYAAFEGGFVVSRLTVFTGYQMHKEARSLKSTKESSLLDDAWRPGRQNKSVHLDGVDWREQGAGKNTCCRRRIDRSRVCSDWPSLDSSRKGKIRGRGGNGRELQWERREEGEEGERYGKEKWRAVLLSERRWCRSSGRRVARLGREGGNGRQWPGADRV